MLFGVCVNRTILLTLSAESTREELSRQSNLSTHPGRIVCVYNNRFESNIPLPAKRMSHLPFAREGSRHLVGSCFFCALARYRQGKAAQKFVRIGKDGAVRVRGYWESALYFSSCLELCGHEPDLSQPLGCVPFGITSLRSASPCMNPGMSRCTRKRICFNIPF